MKISNKIYRDYVYKDEAVLRAQYDPELEFYTTIKSGNIEKVNELCQAKISLSDFYIHTADRANSMDELDELHTTACLDYTGRMKNLRKKKITSKPVARCIDYIYDHLHTKITLANLSELTGLNSSYLSRLFHKETGMTVSDYIQQTKIETAKNMLLHSSYSAAEIASILAFSDQSYFTEVFKKQTGLTPKRYQSLNLNASGLPDR